MTFDDAFEALTGHAPFPWQQRLYHDWFAKGEIPPSCNLPTGLGKTSVVPIWLVALANGAKVPRRMAYVVNRRTVVDQTTAEAERLRESLRKPELAELMERLQTLCGATYDSPLAISTLRGQFADNRQWSADPSRPAVICGTVDMIGSRLLFSGYRLGFKSRPLHGGFLGQDVLLVHDEAHLEPAFQNLITGIEKEQDRERQRSGELPWPKLRVMQLTATTRNDNGQGTQAFALTAHDQEHPVVKQRLEARKQLDLIPVNDDKQVANKIAKIAAGYNDANAAVLVYVRTLEAVGTIERELKKTGRSLVLLTGTIRGKERDDLVEKPEFKRFLKGAETGETVYLVCTSAGEVGIDISADHMVCDLSTFESMAQRFGRVNRFGDRDDTRIDVVYPETFDDKNKLTPARQATLRLLDEQLNGDASPLALSRLDIGQRQAAFAPEPAMLDATDILFDAWALTTIRDKMPGRPPVEPYLHGLAEWEPPRTSIAWRREVEYVTDEQIKLHGDDFPQALLDDYPLKPHELLSDTSERVFKALEAIAKRTNDSCPLWSVDERGQVEVTSLRRLLEREKKQVIRLISDCTILLPPAVGGLRDGMLDGISEHADDVADQPEHPFEGRIRRLRPGSDGLEGVSATGGMRLVRSIELNPDEEDEAARCVWEWYKLKPLEDTRMAPKPVELGTHVDDVECKVEHIIAGLSLPDEIAQAILLAARLHDHGKQRKRFQIALGNRRYPDLLLAKSGRRGARLPEPFRHEFASLVDAANDAQVQRLPPLMQDLALHLIAAHHGRARPHFPAPEAFDPCQSAADAEALVMEIPRRFARLQRHYGRWGLAYLESLLRAADWAASAEPSQFVTETQEGLP